MALLEVRGLKKDFGKTEVLRGIDLSLERGQVLAVIGSSGGGKTTLLRCLNFLDFADAGTISVGGEVIYDGAAAKKMTEAQMRAARLHFGLVFQSFNLFPQYSVLGNVTLAPNLLKLDMPQNIETRARALIERVGLADRADAYPCRLSGGQQQRVAIARALINRPEVLLADEPTGNLDHENATEIMKLLERINALGTTVVVVTHSQEIVDQMGKRVITLNKGRLVSDERKGGSDRED